MYMLHKVMQTLHSAPKVQMTLHEKRAWFNVAVFALALIVFLVVFYFLGFKHSLGSLGLCGFIGLNPYYYRVAFLAHRNKKMQSDVIMDERDNLIPQKAHFFAFSSFWAVFVFTAMGLWATYGEQGCIPITWVAASPLTGFLFLTFVESVATLIQYARGK